MSLGGGNRTICEVGKLGQGAGSRRTAGWRRGECNSQLLYLSQTTWVEAPARPVTSDLGKLLNLFVPPYTHLENRDNDSNFHQGPLRGLNEFSVNHLEIGVGLRQSYAPSPVLALLCPLMSR